MRPVLPALALILGLATPAFAMEDCCTARPEDCQRPVASWVAPPDDGPGLRVRLFGFERPANLAVLDRALRATAGTGLVAIAALDPWAGGPWVRLASGVGATVFLGSALVGYCRAYELLRLSSRPAEPGCKQP
jgi:hypothetical protein